MWSTVLAGHVWHGHFVNRKKDGTTYEEDATISPMRDASGKIVSFVGVLRDVTEQIALEAKLRQSQKMEALGTLAGGVAHDFNNLLTAILGHANLLKVAARSDEGTLDSIAVIEKAAERAADLTRQLLGFARPTRLESSRVDLHDSIDTVVRLLSRTLEKNITLVKHLRAPRPDVIGDPGQIEQVLLNLAVNARDAMPEGGELLFETGSIEIKADEGLWAMQIPPGDYVVISVADTGMGIPTQIQHRIFEPFFTTKAPGKGTGMGLATAYSIIAEHKGTIQMRSQPGLGTTFKIYLPLAAPATQGKGTLQGLEPVAGVGTVMVVDDEELVRETAADMLRRLGYSAVTFASGPEAIAYYAQSMAGVDLVLMDLAMPEMDGSKCFLSLRALNPQVKALLMSGFAPGNVIEAILSEGILGFVGKPFSLADLSIKVAKALGRG